MPYPLNNPPSFINKTYDLDTSWGEKNIETEYSSG